MKASGLFVLVCLWKSTVCAFAPSVTAKPRFRLGGSLLSSSPSSSTVDKLKVNLLEKIATLKQLQEEDGTIAVDFGVKGGEIDRKSRAPRKLDFYTVSERVGKAADGIFDAVEKLSQANPTISATEGLGSIDWEGKPPPLDGPWNLLFSTAADANFSKNSKRGDAKVGNIVDAKKGKITNVIQFVSEDGASKAVEELRVRLKATAEGPNRVNLVFKYVAVRYTRFFFLPLKWTLYIPVPAPTIGKIVVFWTNIKNRLLGLKERRKPPKGYFDVLFLDEDLRVHKTGENNMFVQARPDYKLAWEITQQG